VVIAVITATTTSLDNTVVWVYNIYMGRRRVCMHGGHMEKIIKYKNTKFQELNKEGLIPAIVIQSLYEDEGWSTVKISKYFGISEPVVLRMLNTYEVETRDYYGSKKRKQSAFKSVNIK
jgi:hypothetical protein